MTEQIPITAPPDRIADLPADERPAFRLLRHGAECLSDAELLAVLLDCRTMAEARAVAADSADRETIARRMERDDPKRAARYRAAIEFARRLEIAREPDRLTADPDKIGPQLLARFRDATQEHLTVTLLDSRCRIIGAVGTIVYIGTVNHASVSTRDVARLALDAGACAVILHHNHPSGDASPSPEDLMFTRKMAEALRLLDVELADHIVTGATRYYSMMQRGQI